MKILIIWGESLSKPGAGTVHCLGLAGGLEACGHQVTVITPRYGGARLNTDDLDVRPVPLPRRSVWSFLCFQAITFFCLPLWLLRYRPAAVYVRTCAFQGIMALISRVMGVLLVAEIDSAVDQEILMRGEPVWASALALGLDRCNNRLCSGLVCVTRGLRDESIRRGANPATTAAIPNGARVDVMQPTDRAAARARFGLEEEAVVIGFAGTFSPWQGLEFLIAAADKLRDLPRLKLALMGSGQLEPGLRAQIERRNLGNLFVFLPPGSNEDVAEFLNACDAAVVPICDPRKLRYGLSVLKFWDAVSVGLPVIVPDGSELEEVLADLGLPGVFDPTDPASLAQALRALARAESLSLQRRQEIHARVRQRYSWEVVARKLGRFMQRLRSQIGVRP